MNLEAELAKIKKENNTLKMKSHQKKESEKQTDSGNQLKKSVKFNESISYKDKKIDGTKFISSSQAGLTFDPNEQDSFTVNKLGPIIEIDEETPS